MEEQIFNGLNPSQKEAVAILDGPLLIIAGAGSGKTKCLTHRICNLVANDTKPQEILAVTFTNKAAKEMKERIEKLLSNNSSGSMPTIGTFHSICVQILRRHINYLNCGIDNQFVIFDTSDTKSLIKLTMKEQMFDEKTIKHRAVLSHISNAKNQLITPQQYNDETDDNQFTKAVKKLYPIYQKKLQEHNALDFDDLLQKTVQLLEACPDVLKHYKDRWNHLLIDEYQDTNFAQYRMVRLLSDDHKNICVIGDDHQSIYSFRGADFTNILNFEKDFPNAKIIKLEQNYRSSNSILANANALISHNETGIHKSLWTEKKAGDPVFVNEVANEREEGDFIAKKVLELKRSDEHNYSDCTILYRMHAQSRAIEEALMRNQIPYQIVGGTRFFDRKEIKDIIAYLRVIFNPQDDVSFLRIINTPTRKIGAATLDILKEYSSAYTISLFEALKNIDEISEFSDKKKTVLKDFCELITSFQDLAKKNEPITFLIEEIIKKIEYEKHLDDGSAEGETRIQNVRELLSVALKYNMAENSLASFLEGVALISDIDSYQDNSDCITLMTIHTAKGLEFPIVFLPGWDSKIFPSPNSAENKEKCEEERRLGYVAITRAKEKCFITHAQKRMIFGRSEYAQESKFIAELDTKHIKRTMKKSSDSFRGSRRRYDHGLEKTRQAIFAPKTKKEAIFGIQENNSEFSVGLQIKHTEFGQGTIIMISGDVLTVAFAGIGVKKIVGSVAPIEVLAE